MRRFWDSHCHLDFEDFAQDRQQVWCDANSVGVRRLMIPGITPEQFSLQKSVAQLSSADIQLALGIHPWFIDADNVEQQLAQFDQKLQVHADEIDAIGECGLDFAKPHHDEQMHIAKHQLLAAQRVNKPVILHHRKSHDQLSKLLKAIPPPAGVVHAFSGSFQQASRYLDLGLYLGIGGTITYERSQKTRKVVQKLPLSALVLETDAPAMPLSGKQGQRNHPKFIVDVFNELCELRSESADEIAETLWNNTCQLFPLKTDEKRPL